MGIQNRYIGRCNLRFMNRNKDIYIELIDSWIKRLIDWELVKQMDKYINRQINKQRDRSIDRQVDKSIDTQIDRQINRQINGKM